jgi:general secretion pathway protein G
MRRGFSMIELIFVIVIIGILAGVAIPKLAATRDDAVITQGKSDVAAIRAALSTEKQKRILRGDFNSTYDVDSLLDYGLSDRWTELGGGVYEFKLSSSKSVRFKLDGAKFVCENPNDADCKLLTK